MERPSTSSFLSHSPTAVGSFAQGEEGGHNFKKSRTWAWPPRAYLVPVPVRHTCPHPISDATELLQWCVDGKKGGCWFRMVVVGCWCCLTPDLELPGKAAVFWFFFSLVGLVLVIMPSHYRGWSGKTGSLFAPEMLTTSRRPGEGHHDGLAASIATASVVGTTGSCISPLQPSAP
ncbi:hypothetical protein F5144DRAFT_52268 [Chaetomium tenue]|uniref:Uncharacterized protein n=1 Tax=Chaetomium tenue TaxID=1854479 RepID=A0ACB7PQN3_9PEZI|nr:hypothetical protein F5144DRAFT_52268 [Chaetomium globosum]